MSDGKEKLRLILNIAALTAVIGAHLVAPGSFLTRNESHWLLSLLLVMNVLLSPGGFGAPVSSTETKLILGIIALLLTARLFEIMLGNFHWPEIPEGLESALLLMILGVCTYWTWRNWPSSSTKEMLDSESRDETRSDR